MIETTIATLVVLVALGIFLGSVTTLNRQRALNAESGFASIAAQRVIEELYNAPFDEVYARYNANPVDDPGGAGTAPGALFAVDGLSAPDDVPSGMVGTISFPELEVAPGVFELRERIVDDGLGMPRDLTGDSILDEANHAHDYFLLPTRLTMRWDGRGGVRQTDIVVMLCEYKKDG